MTASNTYKLFGSPVLFAFLEGQYSYDCAACARTEEGVPCCREAEYVTAVPSQMDGLAAHGFGPLIAGEDHGRIRIDVGPGGCPALTESGQCDLELTGGRKLKPALCALFPFSNIVRTAAFVAVSPNTTFVCPIQMEGDPASNRSGYSHVLGEIARYYDGSPELLPETKLPAIDPVYLEDESRRLEMVNRFRGSLSVMDSLSEITGTPAGTLKSNLNRAVSLVGWEVLLEDEKTSTQFLPLIPMLRTGMYDLPNRTIDMVVLVGLQHVLRLSKMSKQSLSIRRITNAFNKARPISKMLCQAHQRVSLKTPLERSPNGDPAVALESMLVLRDCHVQPNRHTLADLLNRHVQASGWRRMLVLAELAKSSLFFQFEETP